MSVYSTDSLENRNEISPREQESLHEFSNDLNLSSIKVSTDLSQDVPFCLEPTSALLTRGQDAGSNETARRTAASKNAIIASEGIADTSKRRPPRRPASSKNRKRDVTNRVTARVYTHNRKQVGSGCRKGSSKTFSAKRSCCSKGNPMIPAKPNKKLGNVLAPRMIQQARKPPRSYLELYRQRFSGARYNRSPEGSTLSVYGDSQQEQLTDDDTCLPATPRDDRSELSFYRGLIEGSTSAAGSSETVHRDALEDTKRFRGRLERNAMADDKSKSPGYRPYTIDEYKTLPIPKLDRSLGPDKVEMQAKREWLTRQRSYGNSVSAHNRHRILMQAQKLKSKHDIAQKCFLPPLKDQDADVKTQCESICSTTFEQDQETTVSKNTIANSSKHSKKNVHVRKVSSLSESKKVERTSSLIEDPYLESLRQRHFYEMEKVDRIINRALCL
ncbi:uncharacterized protein LOC122399468 [Colletes gigas]|uniref:uncharacterized protein LOC122399468 n=1 Tax=Colletes gigas TaxID=935657 RepID=UPI001C9B2871|nr:uncharacterized protein LOC122399468 [Colletes gigas]